MPAWCWLLAYSRKLFIQYYPAFTRFEARLFLREAFLFMEGSCPRCTIDNPSVIVADHEGIVDKKETRITAKGHHPPLNRQRAHNGPCKEELSLRGNSEGLAQYVEQLKKHSPGRAIR